MTYEKISRSIKYVCKIMNEISLVFCLHDDNIKLVVSFHSIKNVLILFDYCQASLYRNFWEFYIQNFVCILLITNFWLLNKI